MNNIKMNYLTYSERCVALFGGFAITTLSSLSMMLSLFVHIENGSYGLFLLLSLLCFLFCVSASMGIGIWRTGSDE